MVTRQRANIDARDDLRKEVVAPEPGSPEGAGNAAGKAGAELPHELERRKFRRELQGQAGEANADGMGFVADVQTNQQGGYGFDDAGVFEFAAVYGAGAWDFLGQVGCDSLCLVVVAADEDVAIDRSELREQFRAHVVKRSRDGHRFGNKFTSLLCG